MLRIVSEQAKKLGLDPLEHQALMQIDGSESRVLQMKQIAGKLDITSDLTGSWIPARSSRASTQS
jgi:hypothetical protein